MKTLTSFSFILFLALESSILINTCFAGINRQVGGEKGQQPASRWQVTIYNYQTNSVLNAHCKSKDTIWANAFWPSKLNSIGDSEWTFCVRLCFGAILIVLMDMLHLRYFGQRTRIGFLKDVTFKTAFGQLLMMGFT